MFHTLINRPATSYVESSGTALVAYAVLLGVQAGWLSPYYPEMGESALYAVVDRLRETASGELRLPDISESTMPYESLAYQMVFRAENKAYGLAALLLAMQAALALDAHDS